MSRSKLGNYSMTSISHLLFSASVIASAVIFSSCADEPKKCADETITECMQNDGCCPPECDYHTDNDCRMDEWAMTYAGGNSIACTSALETDDHGYILTGVLETASGLHDIFLAKINRFGEVVWSNVFGTPVDDLSSILVSTDSNEIYLFMGSESDGAYRTHLLKLGSLGEILWNKSYVSPGRISSVSSLGDNEFIVGFTSSEAFLLVVDKTGEPVWAIQVGGDQYNKVLHSTIQTNDGGLLTAGTKEQTNFEKAWIVKLDANNNVEWEHLYGGTNDAEQSSFSSVLQIGDGGYLAAGYKISDATGQTCGWLVKYDGSGAILWHKSYCCEWCRFERMIESDDSGFLLFGVMDVVFPHLGVLLMKTDQYGNIIWHNQYRIDDDDHRWNWFVEGIISASGKIFFSGYVTTNPETHPGSREIIAFRTDQQGNIGGKCPATIGEQTIFEVTQESIGEFSSTSIVTDYSFNIATQAIFVAELEIEKQGYCSKQ